MLNEKKRNALELLVGKKAADSFLSKVAQTDADAARMGIGFKGLGGVSEAEMNSIVDSLFGGFREKAKEPEKDTPAEESMPAETKAEDTSDAGMSEAEGETEIEIEQTLTTADLEKVADMLEQRVIAAFDQITGKLNAIDEELKTRGYSRMKSADVELSKSLKEFTNKQTDFASEMVKALEEMNTRLKSLEANGTGFSPSAAALNVIGSKERGPSHLSPAEQSAYGMWFSDK